MKTLTRIIVVAHLTISIISMLANRPDWAAVNIGFAIFYQLQLNNEE